MPRYSLDQLIQRANQGNIGRRGLRRLTQAGLDPSELGASGVQSPLNVDPTDDLAARRAALYGHAVEAAHNLAPGQTLSAGLQRRLQLGAGGGSTFIPRSAQQVQSFAEAPTAYNSLLDELRKRSKGIASKSGIYGGF